MNDKPDTTVKRIDFEVEANRIETRITELKTQRTAIDEEIASLTPILKAYRAPKKNKIPNTEDQ